MKLPFTVRGLLRTAVKGRLRKAALAALCLCVLSLCGAGIHFWRTAPNPLSAVLHWPVSPVLLDKNSTLIHARLSSQDEWCLPVPLAEMGDWLPKILVAVEDKRFYRHSGVDWFALMRAVWQNARSGRVVSGASTITSQLVRLSTPRERTFATKFLEFAGALKLERSLSKPEILEYYLNRAPFGGTIRGVEAAARLYFGKQAKALSLGEAALLVGLLKGPTAYRPDKNPKAALARRQSIINKLADQTGISESMRQLALDEPLPAFSPAMPTQAWHFASLAFQTLPGFPENGGVVHSSLDPLAQEILERVLKAHVANLQGDLTAAGLIVDNADARIIAYSGNIRFNPAQRAHWVDCAIAPRSPGSTLKPFVYLEAIDSGAIIPATLLADTPLRLGGEAPRNFDRRYRGPVSAQTALADSLNAPAVRVLRKVGVRKALAFLRAVGFAHLDRVNDAYGDSLVLGAGEVTLLELARAYSTLARFGVDAPLSLTLTPPDHNKEVGMALGATNGPPSAPTRLYSAEAAYLIAEILRDTGRLPFLTQVTRTREETPLAFKTGTSFGLRDAWTAAYTPNYTVVVWFGRTGGGHDPKLIGISLAAPAAIAITRAVEKLPRSSAPASEQNAVATPPASEQNAVATPPASEQSAVATESTNPERSAPVASAPVGGSPANRHPTSTSPASTSPEHSAPAKPGLIIPRREENWYAPPSGIGTAKVCALSGRQALAFCPATRFVPVIRDVWRTAPCPMHALREGKIIVLWPPELEDFTKKRLAHFDASREAFITSPMPGAEYVLTPGARRQPLALKAESVSYPVHWYVDGEFFGTQHTQENQLHWQPSDGEHRISLLDAEERIAVQKVRVNDLAAASTAASPLLPIQ